MPRPMKCQVSDLAPEVRMKRYAVRLRYGSPALPWENPYIASKTSVKVGSRKSRKSETTDTWIAKNVMIGN